MAQDPKTDELLAILEKHFMQGMLLKDWKAFQRTHPTLLKVILNALREVDNQKPKP